MPSMEIKYSYVTSTATAATSSSEILKSYADALQQNVADKLYQTVEGVNDNLNNSVLCK